MCQFFTSDIAYEILVTVHMLISMTLHLCLVKYVRLDANTFDT